MSDPDRAVATIAGAATWAQRVALLRRLPEEFGERDLLRICGDVAERVYAPALAPDFAYVPVHDDYEAATVERAYAAAFEGTGGFERVDEASLEAVLRAAPATVRVFRLIAGLTPQELAACSDVVPPRGSCSVSASRVKSMEAGRGRPRGDEAARLARTIDRVVSGALFPPSPPLRTRLEKPDTAAGWETVRAFARGGVPYATFLHQRHYGGAFRQLLDATSSRRGGLLETAVADLFAAHRVPFVATGTGNQDTIRGLFDLTVRPAPDFVVGDAARGPLALVECKLANDGGTARDKAARFRVLREEGARHGGIPVFAVLAGLGWTRTADALGPVVRWTDGRVFALPELPHLLEVAPFPALVAAP